MPEIARIDGIRITMYFDEADHGWAHFHATKAGEDASIDIVTGLVIEGSLPAGDLKKVREWGDEHRDELLERWERARSHERIDPVT